MNLSYYSWQQTRVCGILNQISQAGGQCKQQCGCRVGIVGGLGPETSCKFCLDLNIFFREITNCQPDIALENLPVPSHIEKEIINGETSQEMFNLLAKAVLRLNNSDCDFIVIPCNTVHVFIGRLRAISKIPILSIVEECADECARLKFKKVGLLATTKSIKDKLHIKPLEKQGIETIIPLEKEQKMVSEAIIKIIHNKSDEKDRQFLLSLIEKFKAAGAQAVILGCTDLCHIIHEQNSSLPIVDTTKVLEMATLNLLLGKL